MRRDEADGVEDAVARRSHGRSWLLGGPCAACGVPRPRLAEMGEGGGGEGGRRGRREEGGRRERGRKQRGGGEGGGGGREAEGETEGGGVSAAVRSPPGRGRAAGRCGGCGPWSHRGRGRSRGRGRCP